MNIYRDREFQALSESIIAFFESNSMVIKNF